jgi:hypothetical protein
MSPIVLAFFVLICAFGSTIALANDSAEFRVKLFLQNAYTGVEMDASDWLSKEMRASDVFNAYGGLKTLVESSTRQAKSYGGFKEIKILCVRHERKDNVITVQMFFCSRSS